MTAAELQAFHTQLWGPKKPHVSQVTQAMTEKPHTSQVTQAMTEGFQGRVTGKAQRTSRTQKPANTKPAHSTSCSAGATQLTPRDKGIPVPLLLSRRSCHGLDDDDDDDLYANIDRILEMPQAQTGLVNVPFHPTTSPGVHVQRPLCPRLLPC